MPEVRYQVMYSHVESRIRPAIFFLLVLLAAGCVADPVPNDREDPFEADRGVVVLNEGVWRMDNASLTLYDPAGDRTVQDWFGVANPGERIGDTGNELTVRGEYLYVILSESATIEVISLPSGRSNGRVLLPPGSSPRSIAFASDSVAWVSCLDEDAVYRWNPLTLQPGMRVPVGPAPEGVAVAAGRLFVANSGLGALREDEEGAGEVDVLDARTGAPVGRIDVGGNLQRMWYLPATGRIYVLVGALLPDTTAGGLVEIDPLTLEVGHRWHVPGVWTGTVDAVAAEAFLVCHRGLYRIALAGSSGLKAPSPPELLVPGPFSTLTDEVPHSVAVAPRTGEVYLGIARGYFQAPGRVDRYGRDGTLVGNFSVGLNPVAIAFN